MALKITKQEYIKLIDQDLAIINKYCPQSLERDHINLVLTDSIDMHYPSKGNQQPDTEANDNKHAVSNNEAGFRLNAMYEKEVADKAKHYIPPISEVPFCPNCESDNTHENLLKHRYRCYDCGFAWAK